MPHFTVKGVSYPLVLPKQWDFREAKLAKALSNGMAPADIEIGMQKGDPDALLAIMVVSARRINSLFDPELLLDNTVLAFFDEIENSADDKDADGEDGDQGPPADAGGPGAEKGQPPSQ